MLSCYKNNTIAVKQRQAIRSTMHMPMRWRKEAGARIAGSRDLDRSKVQAPAIVRTPGGRFRLFYTAVGPGSRSPIARATSSALSPTTGCNFNPRTRHPRRARSARSADVAARPRTERRGAAGWRLAPLFRSPRRRNCSDDDPQRPFVEPHRLDRRAGGAPRDARRSRCPAFPLARPTEAAQLHCIDSRYAGGAPGAGRAEDNGVDQRHHRQWLGLHPGARRPHARPAGAARQRRHHPPPK